MKHYTKPTPLNKDEKKYYEKVKSARLTEIKNSITIPDPIKPDIYRGKAGGKWYTRTNFTSKEAGMLEKPIDTQIEILKDIKKNPFIIETESFIETSENKLTKVTDHLPEDIRKDIFADFYDAITKAQDYIDLYKTDIETFAAQKKGINPVKELPENKVVEEQPKAEINYKEDDIAIEKVAKEQSDWYNSDKMTAVSTVGDFIGNHPVFKGVIDEKYKDIEIMHFEASNGGIIPAKVNDAINGRTNFVNGRPTIYINTNKPLEKCIWSVLHELKHVEQYQAKLNNKLIKQQWDELQELIRKGDEAAYVNHPLEIEANKYADETINKGVEYDRQRGNVRRRSQQDIPVQKYGDGYQAAPNGKGNERERSSSESLPSGESGSVPRIDSTRTTEPVAEQRPITTIKSTSDAVDKALSGELKVDTAEDFDKLCVYLAANDPKISGYKWVNIKQDVADYLQKLSANHIDNPTLKTAIVEIILCISFR